MTGTSTLVGAWQVAPVIAELQKQINEQANVRDSDGKAPKKTSKAGEGPQGQAA